MWKYSPEKIEKKWQKEWEKKGLYKAKDFTKNPKFYILVEFPYPSGDGLHVGHVRSYTALDAVARYKRMQGFNVLYPMGWDAFGLPAENYAIKTGIHPSITVKKNILNFKKQMQALGLSFDWSREINTTDPKYYKWTQWIFLKLFENGLAYKAKMPINWCPSCKIGLANEEVVDGKCERCGAIAEKKEKEQWLLRITKYAERLINDLDTVNYLDKIKASQINWIGKSLGTEVDFELENSNEKITVFTTRIDTIFGVTAVVFSPENSLVGKLTTKENAQAVAGYTREAKAKSEFERTKLEKEKTGVFTGSYCINPLNNERVPVWVGDYVVAAYGGGAVMMVPAHDERDFEFAKKYNIEIRKVIQPHPQKNEKVACVYGIAATAYGILSDSGEFSGLTSEVAIEKITAWLEKNKCGREKINYKLRDWVFSRQHYWGEPIPVVHCSKCGIVPVPEKDLPVKLPFVKKYLPTDTGESPLSEISSWVNTKCPKCKGSAKRETDTMPNWAGSSWYYLAYLMRGISNFQIPISKYEKAFKYWLAPARRSPKGVGGVDWYNGGMEHTTLHLLYSRFWHKFLYDIKVVPCPEPYAKRTSHGMVLAEDGRKMSKSWGNVINPDDVIKQYGADTLRLYEMFMGPFDQMIVWDTNGMTGARRFLDRLWNLILSCSAKKSSKEIVFALNKLIKKITEDLENAKFNTAVAAFMEFLNLAGSNQDGFGNDSAKTLLVLLAPFAPHISEELWKALGGKNSVHLQPWPKFNSGLIKEERNIIIIQVNGRVRGKIEASADITEQQAKESALQQDKIKELTSGKEIKKVIFIKGKLINIVL